MNNIDLINKLAVSHNITTGRAEMIISITFERLIERLMKDGEIKIENFGIFRIMRKKSEQNYMKMDEPLQLPKNLLTFVPDKAFIEGLNSK